GGRGLRARPPPRGAASASAARTSWCGVFAPVRAPTLGDVAARSTGRRRRRRALLLVHAVAEQRVHGAGLGLRRAAAAGAAIDEVVRDGEDLVHRRARRDPECGEGRRNLWCAAERGERLAAVAG